MNWDNASVMSNGLQEEGMDNSTGVRTDAELFGRALQIPFGGNDNDVDNNNNYNVGEHLRNQSGCSGTAGPDGPFYDGIVGRSAILQQSIMRRQALGGAVGTSVSCVGLCCV